MKYSEYESLSARAEASARADGGLVDPVKLRKIERLPRSHDWRLAVLGHSAKPTLVEMHLLLIADADGIDPPLPPAVSELRAAQQAAEEAKRADDQARNEARLLEWLALAEALPAPVGVAYNYSGPNHYEMYTQGAVHIIVREALTVGRLTRLAGDALCTTDSNRRRQLFADQDVPHDRYPSCKTCIRTACRLTGLAAPRMIQSGKR